MTVKPFDAVEIGLTRTAQWCGDDRNCDWDTFVNLVTGDDNAGENVDPDEEPGNQMAGWDLRWASPFSWSSSSASSWPKTSPSPT